METVGFGMASVVYQGNASYIIDACICSTNKGVYFTCILQTSEVSSFQWVFYLDDHSRGIWNTAK